MALRAVETLVGRVGELEVPLGTVLPKENVISWGRENVRSALRALWHRVQFFATGSVW